MNKGQTATEYLIILAVVIIIALIVIGVMGGIPGLGGTPKNETKDCCNAQFNGSGAYMPNPASVYCGCLGGDTLINETEAGQQSLCRLNGVVKDEWELYRTDCPILNSTE